MTGKRLRIHIPKDAVSEFCRRNHIDRGKNETIERNVV
jgi:hypothetical protein